MRKIAIALIVLGVFVGCSDIADEEPPTPPTTCNGLSGEAYNECVELVIEAHRNRD